MPPNGNNVLWTLVGIALLLVLILILLGEIQL